MDENTLLRRLKRYGGHTLFLSQISKDYVKKDPQKLYKTVVAELGLFKGPLMKVGQLLSMVPGVLPDELTEMLRTLQAEAPPMGPLFVQRRLRGELGKDWQSLFSEINLSPSFSASIGQVHQATTLDGHKIALKLQYPNMDGILQADLTQLKLILALYEKSGGALRTDQFLMETTVHLYEEIDYLHEAQNIKMFRSIFQNTSFVHIPKVLPSLSTKRLLAMDWMEGDPLSKIIDQPHEVRAQATKRLFWSWYYPLYAHNALHGDPHAGNFLFSKDNHVILLDFGCVRHFSPTFLEGTRCLYKKLKNNKKDSAEAYEMWGFKNLTPDLTASLNEWASFLYGPLLENKVQKLGASYNGAIAKKLGKRILNDLKKQGKVDLPREFILMHRAAVGMGAAFLQLDSALNWQEEFEGVLDAAVSANH